MIDQPALFDLAAEPLPAAEPVLNDRQQLVLQHLNQHPEGVHADEGGAVAHTIPGPRSTYTHGIDERCDWCAKTGRGILEKLVDLGYAKRRRGGELGRGTRYVPVNASAQPADPLDGPGELPEGF